MNKENFIIELQKLNINLTPKQISDLDYYCHFLIEYNQHTNLTAIKEENQVYLKHFYDSLTIVKGLDLSKYHNLIDIGTGAGFPGMVLKIIFPHLNITLLDSNNKKITFLQQLAEKLNLTNINFFHGRAEEFCQKNRETFEIVTARAVSNMNTLAELCLPLVKKDYYFIALKGSNKEEIIDAQNAISILGGKIEKNIEFNLPIEDSGRNIVVIKKIKNTPNVYPRRYEKIIKKPLK